VTPFIRRWKVALLAILILAPANARSQGANADRQPKRFAIIFNTGYGGDHLPKDPSEFEKLVKTVKEAHFNVILCAYDPKRAAICKKHDVQLFVDLLVPEHHVYKETEACKKLLESLRNNPTIFGYHLWSDNIAGTAAGRSRDVKNVHEWDPTHPAYVGSYRMSKVGAVEGMDLFGYYDFHWTRGGHWAHLNLALRVTKARQIPFLRYDAADPGLIGKGNPNRAGYTIATSIPFGLKGYMFHYAGGIIDARTGQLDALGKDVQKVNARFASIGPELMRLTQPIAVYSTPIATDARDRKMDAVALPAGLASIPPEAWFHAKSGEVLIGVCRDAANRDVLILACHNPFRSQDVTLAFKAGTKKAERFNHRQGDWQVLPIADRQTRVTVEDYAVELVRVERE
jgi:hypothetical protein